MLLKWLMNFLVKATKKKIGEFFAHLAYCLQTLEQTRAIIHATDTDIMLSCHHLLSLERLQEIWIQMNDRYMTLHDLLTLLSIKYDTDHKEMSGILLATYVLGGCDTVKYHTDLARKRLLRLFSA